MANVAHPRKKIGRKEAAGPKGRFAAHLRDLMDDKGWDVADLHYRLMHSGVDVGKPAIHRWLRGQSMPRAEDLEAIGMAFGLRDPRFILPPPR